MNGIHDLGGLHCFGAINPEPNEPVFHAEWEKRVFGLFATVAAATGFSVDAFRHCIEKMSPTEYLETSYYEHWLHSFEVLLEERGLISKAELDARVAQLSQGA